MELPQRDLTKPLSTNRYYLTEPLLPNLLQNLTQSLTPLDNQFRFYPQSGQPFPFNAETNSPTTLDASLSSKTKSINLKHGG